MASFLIDGYVEGYLALARNYRESADALLDSALKSGEPRDWGYPVLSSLMVSVMKPLCNPDRPLGRGVYRTLTNIAAYSRSNSSKSERRTLLAI